MVATPIGNLDDLSLRAARVLSEVDLIAAEDTRHSRKLLSRFNIATAVTSYHHHNESVKCRKLLSELNKGKNIALISDAGTPLLNDPGRLLVNLAHRNEVEVIPVPGPSALLSALSACGLKIDRIAFEGFLPARRQDRRKALKHLTLESRSIVFFEAPHRISESMLDLAEILGAERNACLAKEMTKVYETIRVGTLGELANWVTQNSEYQKGEFVVVVEAMNQPAEPTDTFADHTLRILLREYSPSKSAELAAEILGQRRNRLYKRALELTKT